MTFAHLWYKNKLWAKTDCDMHTQMPFDCLPRLHFPQVLLFLMCPKIAFDVMYILCTYLWESVVIHVQSLPEMYTEGSFLCMICCFLSCCCSFFSVEGSKILAASSTFACVGMCGGASACILGAVTLLVCCWLDAKTENGNCSDIAWFVHGSWTHKFRGNL